MLPNKIVEMINVSKRLGAVQALKEVSFDVYPGEAVVLLGPNGAGKTTALNMILGLLNPNKGSVKIFGLNPNHIRARQRRGAMLQEVELIEKLRVKELLHLFTSYYPNGLGIDQLIQMTKLEAIRDRFYRRLSGGQKRLVQFAISICGRPELLILDEPTVAIDTQMREIMWSNIKMLITNGCAIILSTHHMEEAEELANKVVLMDSGKVIHAGSSKETIGLVNLNTISCFTSLSPEIIRAWESVLTVRGRNDGKMEIVCRDPDSVTKRLVMENTALRELDVKRCDLELAISELIKKAPTQNGEKPFTKQI